MMCRKSRDSPMGEVNGMGKFSIGVVKKFDNDGVVVRLSHLLMSFL